MSSTFAVAIGDPALRETNISVLWLPDIADKRRVALWGIPAVQRSRAMPLTAVWCWLAVQHTVLPLTTAWPPSPFPVAKKNVEARPRRDALQPLGFASALLLLPVDQADVEPAIPAVPVLDIQPMRAWPARLHAAEGCAKARSFSRGTAGTRNSHFSSNHCGVTTDAAVWRPREPRIHRACQRQWTGVTTPLSATPRSVVTPAASASPQGFSGI